MLLLLLLLLCTHIVAAAVKTRTTIQISSPASAALFALAGAGIAETAVAALEPAARAIP
jgi:hypothetical protein